MYNHRALIRVIYVTILVVVAIATVALVSVVKTKLYVYEQVDRQVTSPTETIAPFPVSVNPAAGVIEALESPNQSAGFQLAEAPAAEPSWIQRILGAFSLRDWYQNLASPVSRIVIIWPGNRKEEVATHIGDILRWSEAEKQAFLDAVVSQEPVLDEGKFYPGEYVTHRYAKPQEVADMLLTEFDTEVLSRYTQEVEQQVPLTDALTIASLLEREASDFQNMREVAGVIWNRLFIGMPLQLDATLQYARANQGTSRNWWPNPAPVDKYIDSPYNTYDRTGLPPGPIANPSSEAVYAALNPIVTDCYYYFHTNDGQYFCSVTYEEHVDKLKATFGRGR